MLTTVVNGYEVCGPDLVSLTVDGNDVMHLRLAYGADARNLTQAEHEAIIRAALAGLGFSPLPEQGTPAARGITSQFTRNPAADRNAEFMARFNAGCRREMAELLDRAADFVGGFEDDDTQEGIAPLLLALREAAKLWGAPNAEGDAKPPQLRLGQLVRLNGRPSRGGVVVGFDFLKGANISWEGRAPVFAALSLLSWDFVRECWIHSDGEAVTAL